MDARIVNANEIKTKITGKRNQEIKLDNGDSAVIIRPMNVERTSYLVGIEETEWNC